MLSDVSKAAKMTPLASVFVSSSAFGGVSLSNA